MAKSWLPVPTPFFTPFESRIAWLAEARCHSASTPSKFWVMSPRCVANTVFNEACELTIQFIWAV